MTCAVCSRQGRGFGYFNSAQRLAGTKSACCQSPDRWGFCSMRCLDAFSSVMERLNSVQEGAVIDPTDLEIAAMGAALAPLGDYVSTIGMDRPLSDYQKEDVMRLIEVVIDAYQAHMLDAHERMAEKDRAYFEQRLAAQSQPQAASGANTRIPF